MRTSRHASEVFGDVSIECARGSARRQRAAIALGPEAESCCASSSRARKNRDKRGGFRLVSRAACQNHARGAQWPLLKKFEKVNVGRHQSASRPSISS
jgi:hypothetical protein